jgi:putative transposase
MAINEANLLVFHTYFLGIPLRNYSVAQVVGYIKGKSAIHIARTYSYRKRNFVGEHFWARGYFASTVGRDENVIRMYIRNQVKEDQRVEQLKLF